MDFYLSPPGFAPDPTPSHDAMLLLHYRDNSIRYRQNASCRLRSDSTCSTDRQATITSMRLVEEVAGSGIAPGSRGLTGLLHTRCIRRSKKTRGRESNPRERRLMRPLRDANALPEEWKCSNQDTGHGGPAPQTQDYCVQSVFKTVPARLSGSGPMSLWL